MIWQTKAWWKMLLATKQVKKIIQVGEIYIEKRQIGLNQFGLFILWYNSEISQKLSEKLQNICKKELYRKKTYKSFKYIKWMIL